MTDTLTNKSSLKEIASEAKKRAAIVAFFLLFPLILPTIVYATIFFLTDIDMQRSVGPVTDYASIAYPTRGNPVPDTFIAKGTVSAIPKGHFAYISTGSQGLYWPKIQTKTGPWTLNMTAQGDSGYKYDLSLIAVDKAGKTRIDKWFFQGKETGKYPALSNFSNLRILATIKVEK